MMSRFRILNALLIFMSFFSNAEYLSVDNYKAKVILVDGLSTMWVEIENQSEFNDISKWSPIMETRPDRRLIRIHLYGVQKIKRGDFTDPNDKQYKMYRLLAESMKNKEVIIDCYETTIKENIPVCKVSRKGIDLSSNIISSGSSKFTKEDSRNKEFNIKYKKMENKAKEMEIGIWEPFYLLRMNLKSSIEKI